MDTSSNDVQYKRLWTEKSSKLLIEVFKKYYELWKNGSIDKKNRMWQKIGDELQKRGLDCTPAQAENKYKTLIRSYRKACGITPGRNGRRSHKPFTEELTDIFIENMGLVPECIIDEDEIIIDTSNQEQFLDESTGSIFTLAPEIVPLSRQRHTKAENNKISYIDVNEEDEDDEEEEEHDPNSLDVRIEKIIKSNEHILKKTASNRTKQNLPRRKVVSVSSKTNVDVLLEMKELFKKIEIRRQARHEQNLKIAKERNEILRRKNELLESLLAQHNI